MCNNKKVKEGAYVPPCSFFFCFLGDDKRIKESDLDKIWLDSIRDSIEYEKEIIENELSTFF